MRTKTQTTGVVAHLTELRKRLLYSFAALGIASIISLFFAKRLYHWLSLPLLPYLQEGSSFIVTSPFESYITYFKVAFAFGFLSPPSGRSMSIKSTHSARSTLG